MKPEVRQCTECGWLPAPLTLPEVLLDPGRPGGVVLMAIGTFACVGLWLAGVTSVSLYGGALGFALVGMLAVIAGTVRRR